MTETYEEIQAKLNVLYDQRDSIFAQIRELDAKAEKLFKKKEEKQNLTFEESLVTYVAERESIVRSKKKDEYLLKYSRSIGSGVELRSFGYYPETNQSAIQISIHEKAKRKVLEKAVVVLNEVLKVIKPLDLSKTIVRSNSKELISPAKLIGISEKTCAQFGVFKLLASDDLDRFMIMKTVYGMTSVLVETKSLLEILIKIQEICPND